MSSVPCLWLVYIVLKCVCVMCCVEVAIQETIISRVLQLKNLGLIDRLYSKETGGVLAKIHVGRLGSLWPMKTVSLPLSFPLFGCSESFSPIPRSSLAYRSGGVWFVRWWCLTSLRSPAAQRRSGHHRWGTSQGRRKLEWVAFHRTYVYETYVDGQIGCCGVSSGPLSYCV